MCTVCDELEWHVRFTTVFLKALSHKDYLDITFLNAVFYSFQI